MWCDDCGEEIDFFDIHEGLNGEFLCYGCSLKQEYLEDEVYGEDSDNE